MLDGDSVRKENRSNKRVSSGRDSVQARPCKDADTLLSTFLTLHVPPNQTGPRRIRDHPRQTDMLSYPGQCNRNVSSKWSVKIRDRLGTIKVQVDRGRPALRPRGSSPRIKGELAIPYKSPNETNPWRNRGDGKR